MKRALTTIAGLVVAQAAMVGLWYAVEHSRAPEAEPTSSEAASPPSTLVMPAPDLRLRQRDGRTLRLDETRGQPLVLHFWATWCEPCRQELSALLAYAQEADTPVLAVSLDPEWDAVRKFFGAAPPQQVVLARSDDIAKAFDVSELPVTLVLDRAGVRRLRMDGARDWASSTVRDAVREAAGR